MARRAFNTTGCVLLNAALLRALAEVYIAQRKYTAAEPLYQHLLSIQEKAGGPQNTEYAANLAKYGFLLRKLKRKTEAAEVSAQARAASSPAITGLPSTIPNHPLSSTNSLSYGERR